jgi:hypothetical protein
VRTCRRSVSSSARGSSTGWRSTRIPGGRHQRDHPQRPVGVHPAEGGVAVGVDEVEQRGAAAALVLAVGEQHVPPRVGARERARRGRGPAPVDRRRERAQLGGVDLAHAARVGHPVAEGDAATVDLHRAVGGGDAVAEAAVDAALARREQRQRVSPRDEGAVLGRHQGAQDPPAAVDHRHPHPRHARRGDRPAARCREVEREGAGDPDRAVVGVLGQQEPLGLDQLLDVGGGGLGVVDAERAPVDPEQGGQVLARGDADRGRGHGRDSARAPGGRRAGCGAPVYGR